MSALLMGSLVFVAAHALQLLSVSQTVGNHHHDQSLGVDFTLYSAVDVTAIGLIDTDEAGVNGTLTAQVFDRSDGRVVIGPVVISAGRARATASNPFVFEPVRVRLERGVYCLVAAGFVDGRDRYINQGFLDDDIDDAIITVVNSALVAVTSGVYGGDGNASILPSDSNRFESDIYAAATLVFSFAAEHVAVRVPLVEETFGDCEAVVCAGLPTGDYNIRGQVRFCDNDATGGGWLLLWSADNAVCESNNWSSSRNPHVSGNDPIGCRPAATSCPGTRLDAPFAFSEVRGENWSVWSFGSPGAFNSQSFPCEGVLIRGTNGSVIWALAAGFEPFTYARCPCSPGFTNTSATSRNLDSNQNDWTCDLAPIAASDAGIWARLFRADSPFLCSGLAATTLGDALWFQKELASPQSWLSVSICKNEVDSDEDLKLTSGKLYICYTNLCISFQIKERRKIR
jgi:hypothetical protein